MNSIVNKIIYISIFCFSLVIILPNVSFGQTISGALQNTSLSASTVSPLPNQDVTITLKSFGIDSDSSTIIWYVDGTEAKRGVGLTSIVTKAPELGKKKIVSATIISVNEKRQSASIEIGSGSIDIITETSGYNHPFFLGKFSPVFQNNIKIIAVPHIADSNGVEFNPNNLVYTWEKDGLVIGDASGYAKQSLVISGSTVPRPFTITVTASTRDGKRQAKIATNVSYSDPEIQFYSNDPLYGPLFNKALSNRVYLDTQRELGVIMIPYGFDKPSNDIGSLRLSWDINGSENQNLSRNESIIVRSPQGTFGSSDIGLRIQNTSQILQSAVNAFSVSFRSSNEENQTFSDSLSF